MEKTLPFIINFDKQSKPSSTIWAQLKSMCLRPQNQNYFSTRMLLHVWMGSATPERGLAYLAADLITVAARTCSRHVTSKEDLVAATWVNLTTAQKSLPRLCTSEEPGYDQQKHGQRTRYHHRINATSSLCLHSGLLLSPCAWP